MNKTKILDRILIVLTCVFFVFLSIHYYNIYNNNVSTDVVDGNLVICNLDVGKADAAVIELDGVHGMIDTGLEESYGKISKYLDDNGITTLDFLILTHYDKDHVGSAKKIIKNYNVSKIIVPDYVSEKENYENLMKLFMELDTVDSISNKASYEFGSLSFDIYPASNPDEIKKTVETVDNDMSLVVKMSYGIDTFLFMGDTCITRMSQILEDGTDLSANWIKMPHHGAFNETDDNKVQNKLLEKVSPTYAVVSTDYDKFNGDSADETVKVLKDNCIAAYYTFNGNVVTKCDGVNITVEQ